MIRFMVHKLQSSGDVLSVETWVPIDRGPGRASVVKARLRRWQAKGKKKSDALVSIFPSVKISGF